MRKSEKYRLMKKFRIKECGGGQWAVGFLEGLQASEDYKKRPIIKKEDIILPECVKT